MTDYWEIAARSAYDMFSKYRYLIVNSIFPTSGFGVGVSFSLRLFMFVAYLYLFISCVLPYLLSQIDHQANRAVYSENIFGIYYTSSE